MSSFEGDITALFASLRFLTQESAYTTTLDRVLDMQEQLTELSAARKLDTRELRNAAVNIEKLEKELGKQTDPVGEGEKDFDGRKT